MKQALVCLGLVVKPHGLKGEIGVKLHANSLFSFDGIKRVYLQRDGQNPRPFVLLAWREHTDRFLLTLENIDGRDIALQWSGADFLLRQKDLPREESIKSLIGFAAYLPSGELLGTVLGVEHYGASPIAVVEKSSGDEILLPAPPEFIGEIDLAEKKCVFCVPDCLPGVSEETKSENAC